MPYWKCSECHHEYEGESRACEWCMTDKEPLMLEEQTPLERLVEVLGKTNEG